jgi:hypothetical protein
MKKKRSVRELEVDAASAEPQKTPKAPAPTEEVMAMLARRGLRPRPTVRDVPFPEKMTKEQADRLSEWLGHYAFRLFLRGAIQRSGGFLPWETTRYLRRDQCGNYAQTLVDLDLAGKMSDGRFRLKWVAASFGGTLEWYVGRELARRLGFSVATGVKLHAHGVGGDLDVVAAAEGKLVYLELKSSPPRNISTGEIVAFFDRLNLLCPDLALFVIDTALRLSDKVLPMIAHEFGRRGLSFKPKRIAAQLWALTPHIYVVNGRRDLMTNIERAVAEGFRALSPRL